MTAFEVVPGGPVRGRLAAPASKSVTNRLLVLAALAEGESALRGPLVSDDSAAMRRVITGLGAEVAVEGPVWRVRGTGGRLRVPAAPLDAGLSGTTLRFGTALAALAPGPVPLTGGAPLLRRPLAPLQAALRDLHRGRVVVDARGSSQFASAVLLVAPYARQALTVVVEGETALAYVELTVAAMCDWGARVEAVGERAWRVAPGAYRARTVTVAPDASAAAHLHALAAATGGAVTVTNVTAETARQPDAALPRVLAGMGARVDRDGDSLTVTGPDRLRTVEADLRAMPDQVTTVAALAALASGTSRLRGVAVARTHETDRLAALAAELGKLGVRVDERPDGLDVHGGTATGPARLATHDDHRLAMAFAAVAARVPGVAIEDPGCVAKTYPDFWSDLAGLGVKWRESR